MQGYTYQVVSGCGVYQRKPSTVQKAKHILLMQQSHHDFTIKDGEKFEIERIEEVGGGARRYWRWRDRRWRLWDASEPSLDDLRKWSIPTDSMSGAAQPLNGEGA